LCKEAQWEKQVGEMRWGDAFAFFAVQEKAK